MILNVRGGSDPAKGFIYALAGSVIVSTNYVTAKYGLRGFNPETFSLVWTTAAAIYSLAIVGTAGQWRQLPRFTCGVGKIGLLGLTTGAGMILTWSGLALLEPSFAAFLWRFLPVLTILLGAIFLGEKLLARELVIVGIMLFGAV